jgi:cytochrome c oxidase subunit 2
MVDLLGLPVNASEHGGRIDIIILLMHILMVVIFVGWGIFFLYTLVRFRKKKNPEADYTGVKSHRSTYIEVAVVVVEAVLLIGFSIPFWAAEVDAFPKSEDDPFEVRVVAQQFNWNAHYPGPDGIFGRTSADLVNDENNLIGLDLEDPNAIDDITGFNLLRVPKGRQVLIHLTTKDVIHSFGVPEFRVKQDAIPGMSIPVQFTATMTTKELREVTGDKYRAFEIACAQLCGNNHYAMKGSVLVQTEEEVQAWLESKAQN